MIGRHSIEAHGDRDQKLHATFIAGERGFADKREQLPRRLVTMFLQQCFGDLPELILAGYRPATLHFYIDVWQLSSPAQRRGAWIVHASLDHCQQRRPSRHQALSGNGP
ncbi:hypothetical protein LZK98_17680 [Sphingomonas cannabina]|uniref:hypothetical protein n=1 Tax=Sphingomonas cannabina TaxID=2899123 RepID=UPI001F27D5E0|nr:hypothetical protein [Sphingomonas cannabina]UIJ44859.1 hypothetical protein LZK98_17680 [Sphingomonas cannabina]